MSSTTLVLAALLGAAMLFNAFTEKISPHKRTEKESAFIAKLVKERIQEMRHSVDSKLGEGFFDAVVSGEIDMIEFIECDDVEEFLKSYSISTTFCGTSTASE